MSRRPISIPEQIERKFDESQVTIDEVVRRLVTDVEPVFREHVMKDSPTLDRESAIAAADRWLARGGGEGMLALRVGLTMMGDGATIDFSNFGEAVRQIVSRIDSDGDGCISRLEIEEAYEACAPPRMQVATNDGRGTGRS